MENTTACLVSSVRLRPPPNTGLGAANTLLDALPGTPFLTYPVSNLGHTSTPTSSGRPSLRPLTKVGALCSSGYLGPFTVFFAFFVRVKIW